MQETSTEDLDIEQTQTRVVVNEEKVIEPTGVEVIGAAAEEVDGTREEDKLTISATLFNIAQCKLHEKDVITNGNRMESTERPRSTSHAPSPQDQGKQANV